jgi:hypothetical protein
MHGLGGSIAVAALGLALVPPRPDQVLAFPPCPEPERIRPGQASG